MNKILIEYLVSSECSIKGLKNMIYFKFIKFLRDESAQGLVSIIKQIELNCMKFSAKKISKGNQ